MQVRWQENSSLQAEVPACGLELADVPNLCWHLLHGLS